MTVKKRANERKITIRAFEKIGPFNHSVHSNETRCSKPNKKKLCASGLPHSGRSVCPKVFRVDGSPLSVHPFTSRRVPPLRGFAKTGSSIRRHIDRRQESERNNKHNETKNPTKTDSKKDENIERKIDR